MICLFPINSHFELKISHIILQKSHSLRQFRIKKPIGKLPLYKEVSFTYRAIDGVKYVAIITFDWEQSAETYKKVFGEHPEEVTAQLYFRLNRNNTHVTTRLIGSNGKDLIIEPKNISIAEINQNRAPFD